MLVVDTNILIYAAHSGSIHHAATTDWLAEALSGREILGLPWAAVLGFVRITTNPRVFPQPSSAEEALIAIEAWTTHPSVSTVEPTSRHLSVLGGLLRQSGTAGNLTTDAHIAALAIEHGARVVSFDRDMERFGIEVVVPRARA